MYRVTVKPGVSLFVQYFYKNDRIKCNGVLVFNTVEIECLIEHCARQQEDRLVVEGVTFIEAQKNNAFIN